MAEIALLYVPVLVLLGLILRYQESLRWPWTVWIVVFFLVHTTMWAVGMHFYVAYVWRVATDSGVRCPHCQKFLISPGLARRVIAFGKCTRCGLWVLDDTP